MLTQYPLFALAKLEGNMRPRPRRLARALLLATFAIPLAAGIALAAHEPSRFGLTPVDEDGPYFDLTMDAGETRRLEVEVANFGHDEGTARTYAADVYSIINGGFGAELFGEQPDGTTLWLDYETQEITLGPNEALVIEFTVAVPEGTAPGEYVTSLVVENAVPFAPSPGEGGIGIAQVNRNAIAVAIDVPGPRTPSLEIGAVGHKHAAGMSFVTFEVRNTGNVHLRPAGEFVLRDSAGEPIATWDAVMDSVYAGTETLLEAPLTEELQPGDYCAELSLTDEETGASDATECLAFTVAEEDDQQGTDDGAAPGGIPVIQPVIDAAEGGDVYPMLAGAGLLAGLALVALIVVMLVHGLRGRRTR